MALYDTLSAVYDRVFPVNPATIVAIEKQVPTTAPRRVLDLGAATVGHLAGFKERGWNTLGIELNPSMVAHARKGVTIIEGSMLDAENLVAKYLESGLGAFGAIVCLGNTLAHLAPEKLGGFFASIRRLLAPSCPFVIQMLNYANPVVRPGFAFPEIRSDGLVFLRHYEAGTRQDSLIFVTEISVGTGTETEAMTDRTELYAIKPNLLENELKKAGFGRIDLVADWSGMPFSEERDLYSITFAR
jgi:SAM-dependent methyltransferase